MVRLREGVAARVWERDSDSASADWRGLALLDWLADSLDDSEGVPWEEELWEELDEGLDEGLGEGLDEGVPWEEELWERLGEGLDEGVP